MANLYLTEQGSVLRKTGNRIVVEKDEKVLLRCAVQQDRCGPYLRQRAVHHPGRA